MNIFSNQGLSNRDWAMCCIKIENTIEKRP